MTRNIVQAHGLRSLPHLSTVIGRLFSALSEPVKVGPQVGTGLATGPDLQEPRANKRPFQPSLIIPRSRRLTSYYFLFLLLYQYLLLKFTDLTCRRGLLRASKEVAEVVQHQRVLELVQQKDKSQNRRDTSTKNPRTKQQLRTTLPTDGGTAFK